MVVSTDSIRNLSSLGLGVSQSNFDKTQEESKRVSIRQIGFNIATLAQQKGHGFKVPIKTKLEVKKGGKDKEIAKEKDLNSAKLIEKEAVCNSLLQIYRNDLTLNNQLI